MQIQIYILYFEIAQHPRDFYRAGRSFSDAIDWLNEHITGADTDIEAIAAHERCSVRKVNMTISLAFLAPELVRAAVEGRLPTGSS